MKSETAASNPIQLLNDRVSEAKAQADAKLLEIRQERQRFERAGFTPTDGVASPAAFAAAQSQWESRRAALLSAERTFRPSTFAMDFCDGAEDTKRMLLAGLKFLKSKADATPKLVKDEAIAEVHPLPSGGLFGVPAPTDIDKDLAELEAEMKVYPDHLSFVQIVPTFNRINSAIDALAEKAKPTLPAKRMDKPFRPLHG